MAGTCIRPVGAVDTERNGWTRQGSRTWNGRTRGWCARKEGSGDQAETCMIGSHDWARDGPIPGCGTRTEAGFLARRLMDLLPDLLISRYLLKTFKENQGTRKWQ